MRSRVQVLVQPLAEMQKNAAYKKKMQGKAAYKKIQVVGPFPEPCASGSYMHRAPSFFYSSAFAFQTSRVFFFQQMLAASHHAKHAQSHRNSLPLTKSKAQEGPRRGASIIPRSRECELHVTLLQKNFTETGKMPTALEPRSR